MEKNELWCDIPLFNGKFQVSNIGRVRRVSDGYILGQYFHEKGYLKVDLEKWGVRKKCRVHRLVAEAFIENPNNYPQVNHKNGMKTDNRVENLEWVTNQMNMEHAFKIGLRKRKNNE